MNVRIRSNNDRPNIHNIFIEQDIARSEGITSVKNSKRRRGINENPFFFMSVRCLTIYELGRVTIKKLKRIELKRTRVGKIAARRKTVEGDEPIKPVTQASFSNLYVELDIGQEENGIKL